ncbi:FkbM family methyltransferase [Novosphingobium sp. PC22D]|uniref:FkbM family methyltransferase n=1 Tax=Novosphingobium sp. PC22D TaxID=1962403 RepID=UPI00143B426A|nr:FkbM family methyltransferase [Novosphingobium sp. PC22D]
MGDRTVLCRILGDNKFFVFSDDAGLAPHLIFDGYWEFWLTRYFAEMIQPGDTVIDIGANVGYYSVLAAELVSGTGRVVAIEPNPEVYALLARNMGVNGFASRSEARNFALSFAGGTGSLPFFVPKGEPKNGRFVVEGESIDFLSDHGAVFQVELGGLLANDFDRIDFIKIDVEGAEIAVLDHIRPLVERFHPKVVCEVNFARGYSYDDIQRSIGTKDDLQFLDFDAKVKPLTREMAHNERPADDWLVCF